MSTSIPKTVTTKPSFKIDSHSISSFFDSGIDVFLESIAHTAKGSVADIITPNNSAGSRGIPNTKLRKNAINTILITTPILASILVVNNILRK